MCCLANGQDPRLLSEIFNTSSARCWSSGKGSSARPPPQGCPTAYSALVPQASCSCRANAAHARPVVPGLGAHRQRLCVCAMHRSPHPPVLLLLQITKLHLQCKYPALAEIYNPVPGVVEGVPSSRGYHGGFSSQLMVKDLRWGPRGALALAVKPSGLCNADCALFTV